MIRLDKYMCDVGVGSRSSVREIVKNGQVWVNDKKVLDPGYKLCPEQDRVMWAGKILSVEPFSYYMLYKPTDVVCATKDNFSRTVLDLLVGVPQKDLFPVGRLDKDTEGLLLITNDGPLAHRLLSPKKHVPKTYLVYTQFPVTFDMLYCLEKGVNIGDDTPTLPAVTQPLTDGRRGLRLTITEGRYHQVKRMLAAVGNEVIYLKRLSMGALSLDETLSPGEFRPLTGEEKQSLGL